MASTSNALRPVDTLLTASVVIMIDPSPSGHPGLNLEAVTAWLNAHVSEPTGPLEWSLIAGGHSNLTFELCSQDGRRWVLRRPPLGQILATAHDMGREYRIISALADTPVPVASVVGLCTDVEVNGAPFYVMDFVEGLVVRSLEGAATLSPSQRHAASESLVDVLAQIHSVDLDNVGLADLGRHDGYIERQLRRWYGQFQGSQAQNPNLDLPAVDEVFQLLMENLPAQQATSIVHGDYRLDNCILDRDGKLAAVLDWEICTLGDPLADLGLLWVYWTDPGTTASLPQASPTSLDGFLRKQDLLDRYSAVSSLDLSGIDYYIAFGYWKLTCIIAGVFARYAGGAMGDTSQAQIDGFLDMVRTLSTEAEQAAQHIRATSLTSEAESTGIPHGRD